MYCVSNFEFCEPTMFSPYWFIKIYSKKNHQKRLKHFNIEINGAALAVVLGSLLLCQNGLIKQFLYSSHNDRFRKIEGVIFHAQIMPKFFIHV